MRCLRIVPERSTVVVEARSNVGPIAWEGAGPTGTFSFDASGDEVVAGTPPRGWLELRLDHLTSGSRIYDSELLRRVDAHRFPIARIELEDLGARTDDGTYHARGRVTVHGITRRITGHVAVEARADGSVQVSGVQALDIREFGLPAPTMLGLRVYPEVSVHLFVEGDPVD